MLTRSHPTPRGRSRSARTITLTLLATLLAASPITRTLDAQWVTTTEQFYPGGSWNWRFLTIYPNSARLFNAFDYGHAILYETLWRESGSKAIARLEGREFDFLTKSLLVNPPRLPLAEEAVMPSYARLAPEAKMMFEWAHILHRQIYDIWADGRLDEATKDAETARVFRAYLSRPDLAFSTKPKSMRLMQEMPYSLAFRQQYPKFNGLIWAYHWLQVGLYEPLLAAETPAARDSMVRATTDRFRAMIADAPRYTPHVMPMTAAIAPRFAARYPGIAIVFDNLHSMHDVISDILANDSVPKRDKRREILLAAARYRDSTSYIMPDSAWRTMAAAMGIENQGGPAVGFAEAFPTPTVSRGAVMRHDDATGQHVGMGWGEMLMPGMDHRGHAMPPDTARTFSFRRSTARTEARASRSPCDARCAAFR
jgi:hypothetical protein